MAAWIEFSSLSNFAALLLSVIYAGKIPTGHNLVNQSRAQFVERLTDARDAWLARFLERHIARVRLRLLLGPQ
jgi:hypothetical protein